MATNYTPIDSSEKTSESISSSPNIKDDFLNQLLMCGICLSRMSSPCCLPCAHSFCRSCLIDYAHNNNNSPTSNNFILCPYCKYQLNFHSYEHFESLLIINPVLKELCETLDASNLSFRKQQQTQSNTEYQARCHTCGLLKMLKICKHCQFMLCETCRRSHLLDVHRESKLQLDLLQLRIDLIERKHSEMDKRSQEYDCTRQRIQTYAQKIIDEVEKQRDQALELINERQNSSSVYFWKATGFDSQEKFNSFVSFVQKSQKKLSERHITDKDLLELSDHLQTIPCLDEKLFESVQFPRLSLKLDENFSTKQLICVSDDENTLKENENITDTDEQADCVSS